MPNVFDLLQEDHRAVETLFGQFEQSGDYDVALRICEEFTLHAAIEEELVYPLYRAKVDTAGADEARREHQEAKDLIAQIESMGAEGEELQSVMETLQGAVSHHVEEEETVLFPKMQEQISGLVDRMGPELVLRKETLQSQRDADRGLGLDATVNGQEGVTAPDPMP
ncbi:hypothetical protein BH18ACT4_BH18ACT4_15640 [soil metagenome]